VGLRYRSRAYPKIFACICAAIWRLHLQKRADFAKFLWPSCYSLLQPIHACSKCLRRLFFGWCAFRSSILFTWRSFPPQSHACAEYYSFPLVFHCRLATLSALGAELDVCPVFLTQPDPQVKWPNSIWPRINMKLWTRPSLTHLCTNYSFAISCRVLQFVHQMSLQSDANVIVLRATAFCQNNTSLLLWSRAQHQHHVTTSLMKLAVGERNVATNLGINYRLCQRILF